MCTQCTLAFPEQTLLSHHRRVRCSWQWQQLLPVSAPMGSPSCFRSPHALQPLTPGSVCWDLLQGIKVGWPKHVTPPKAWLAPAAVLAKLLPPQLPNSWSLLLNMFRWPSSLVHPVHLVAKHSSSAGALQAVQLSPTQGNNCCKADRTESWG